MSGEFGRYNSSGYIAEQVLNLAEDLSEGHHELTILWGKFIEKFYGVANAIAWVEANDSLPEEIKIASLQTISSLRRLLNEIEQVVSK